MTLKFNRELRRISREIALLAEAIDHGGSGASSCGEDDLDPRRIRSIIRRRRRRRRIFGDVFGEPAWDMTLDLMAAKLEGKRISVSSLCIAAAVPATTALRWIKMLVNEGVFLRVPDKVDQRRIYIELSEDTERAVRQYLSETT
jgi:hypothetical protein